MKQDFLLAVWLLVDLLWDSFVFTACGYLVFWRGRSGWLFLPAILLCWNSTLYKALVKRFSLPEEK